MNELVSAAAALQRLMEQQRWKFCFIGGLAVQCRLLGSVVRLSQPTKLRWCGWDSRTTFLEEWPSALYKPHEDGGAPSGGILGAPPSRAA